jgi:SPP1 gp7 family putative phage head morphogenesis protein
MPLMPNKSAFETQRKLDPTRTSGLRRRFLADVNRRFASLKKDIGASIIGNNCFGIRQPLSGNTPINRGAFDFKRDPEKVEAFINWLIEQEAKGILEIIYKPGTRQGIDSAWTDLYIKSAYEQGVKRAIAEMKRMGFDLSQMGNDPTGQITIRGALRMPIHADALGAVYTRTFEDLKTVLAVMNNDLRKTIAEGLRTGIARGLGEGKSVETVAREIFKDVANGVDKIGLTRARLIARTETIRAHHLANINEYRQIDKDMQIVVKAEFATAKDDAVCDLCADLDGKIFSLDEAEGLIPQHPNCRCACIPYDTGMTSNMRKAS